MVEYTYWSPVGLITAYVYWTFDHNNNLEICIKNYTLFPRQGSYSIYIADVDYDDVDVDYDDVDYIKNN